MGYPLSIVRIKKSLTGSLPLPLGSRLNPLAGPFDGLTRARLSYAIQKFPYATKLDNAVRDTFEVEAPGGGRLDLWLTSDGSLFIDSQAGLELVLALFIDLRAVTRDLAIEDPQRGWVHDAASFRRFIDGQDPSEDRARAFSEEDAA